MNSRLLVEGRDFGSFNGVVEISGAKNAALPSMAAALLTDEPVILESVPQLADIASMITVIASLGANINFMTGNSLEIKTKNLLSAAPAHWVKKIRASILLLGPMLARHGSVQLAMPGGCAIGLRPIMQHLSGLEALGAKIKIDDNVIYANTSGLKGAHIKMDSVSVGATENLIMAASLAEGETIIENAACEPEVTDLIKMLIAMGAKISGIGTSLLHITGVTKLGATTHSVMKDRIEAGTLLIAAAAARGQVRLKNYHAESLMSVINCLKQAGAEINQVGDDLLLSMAGKRPEAVSIETSVYPGFPTDLQAQWVALSTVSGGKCTIRENIFDDRLQHISELVSMGANIAQKGNSIEISGVERLTASLVSGSDLRATAGLVIAANVANGTSEIINAHFIDRGYESFDQKFAQCGMFMQRILEPEHAS